MEYLIAFIVGGLICVVGQIILDTTKLTPGHIIVMFLMIGIVLGAIGVYEPLVKFAEAGATVLIPGFGYLLSKGAIEGVKAKGAIGAFTGGLESAAGATAAAILFGYIMAVVSYPRSKR
jgi:stage V sporulation protein AE